MNKLSVNFDNFEPVNLDTNMDNEEISVFYKASMQALQIQEPIQLQEGTWSSIGEVGSVQSSGCITYVETPFLAEIEEDYLQVNPNVSNGISKLSNSPATFINNYVHNSTHLIVGFSFGTILGLGVATNFLGVNSFTDASYTYTQCFSLIDLFNYVMDKPILMDKINKLIDAFINSSGASAPTLIGMYLFGKKLIKK